ncbi:glycerophosphodiester phosphodiesterase [Blautia schinkii]|nr:glycerophosphodiester phosphodiesterase [Blautia schinkii]
MKKTLSSSLTVIKRNWSTLLWFELIYRILIYTVLYPLLKFLLYKSLTVSGLSYISMENYTLLLRSPRAVSVLVLALLLLSFSVYLEICALILCYESGWHGVRISLKELCKKTLKSTLLLARPSSLLMFVGLLPLLALSLFRVSSSILTAFRVPEFILEFIRADISLYVLYLCVLLFTNLYLFFYVFALPEVVLHKHSFPKALRNGRRLLKGKKKRALMTSVLCVCGLILTALAVTAVCIVLIYAYSRLLFPVDERRYVFENQLIIWGEIGGVLAEVLSTAAILSITLSIRHLCCGDSMAVMERRPFSVYRLLRKVGVLLCTYVFLGLYSESEFFSGFSLPADTSTQIVAHRAGAAYAPENTAAALEECIEDGADWAEVDVQQTKDGTLILMHDDNFKRTAGLDENVWDVNYEDVKHLDAGSYFSPRYTGEPIPTLEEILLLSKNRIKLMIELKYTGHESRLVEQTLALIEKHHMEKQCMIVSMNLSLLEKSKELNPRIKTGYVSALLLAGSYNQQDVDAYSVETTNLTAEMIAEARFHQKLVFAWTANSPRTIKKILAHQADGIITDNPLLARYYLNEKDENSFLDFLKDVFYPYPQKSRPL